MMNTSSTSERQPRLFAGRSSARKVSLGGEHELRPFPKKTFSSEDDLVDAAAALADLSKIANKELITRGKDALWEDDENFPELPDLYGSCSKAKNSSPWWMDPQVGSTKELLKKPAVYASSSSEDDSSESSSSLYSGHSPEETEELAWNRVRSVSFDGIPTTPKTLKSNVLSSFPSFGKGGGELNIVSPMNSPVTQRLPMRKTRGRHSKQAKRDRQNKKQKQSSPPNKKQQSSADASEEKKRTLTSVSVPKGKAVKKILRRKFSWKNYPELEAFLIANREEYLRHSALNYTVQQKQYNNRLTERLLELAAEHGYVFDEKEFSFVTVRDRIRCYFKSYVQSAKKRGIVIGYAARKAGLLSPEELEKSVGTAGKIVMP